MMAPSSPSSGPALAEQYLRVLRFYKRITREDKHEPDYLDDFWAFFQNCWHLRDWIWHDEAIPGSRLKCANPKCRKIRKCIGGSSLCIECEVNSHTNLKICGDLANYSNHLIRKDSSLIGKLKVNLGESMSSGESTGSLACDYVVVLDDGSEMDALEVARKAIDEWRALLLNWGHTPP